MSTYKNTKIETKPPLRKISGSINYFVRKIFYDAYNESLDIWLSLLKNRCATQSKTKDDNIQIAKD